MVHRYYGFRRGLGIATVLLTPHHTRYYECIGLGTLLRICSIGMLSGDILGAILDHITTVSFANLHATLHSPYNHNSYDGNMCHYYSVRGQGSECILIRFLSIFPDCFLLAGRLLHRVVTSR